MVLFNRVPALALRSACLNFSLITVALAALVLLLPARALASCTTTGNPPVTTCTSSGGITVSGTFGASEGSSNVVSGLSSVTNISLTFTNLNVTNLNDVAIVLVPPSASGLKALDLLSGVCGYGTGQIGNSTFTLADSGDTGTDNYSGMMSEIGVGTCPGTFSGTYLPSDYFPGQDTFNSPGPSTYNSGGADPSVAGSGIFNFSSFGENGSVMNGTWTLYIANQNSSTEYANPSGTLGSWSLAFTGSSSTATTTSISANPNGMTLTSPVYTNSNVEGQSTTGTSVTLTATVSPNPGGGTVTFYDSTNSSPGAGTLLASNVPLSSGQAQAVVTFPGTEEGARSISAVYSGTTGYLGSTTPANSEATVLTVNHPYNPSSGTYCNGPVNQNDNPSNGGGTGGYPYPSQLILSGISGTIESVTVTLNGVQVQDPDFSGFMLQAPNGNGYEFMAWADGNGPGGDPASLTNTTVWLADDGSALLQTSSQGTDTPLTCSSGSPCKPADDYVQIDPLYDDTFPSPGSPFTGPTSVGKAYPSGSATFTSQFGGAGANGTWLLYLNNWLSENPSTNPLIPYGEVASWCLNLTMQASAHATTTALVASPNPATITSGTTTTVNLTATVTVTDGTPFSDDSNPGSVTFVDGSTNLGTAAISNGGVASLTGVALAEGTHQIVASYSGTSSGTEFGISSSTLDMRVDTATTIPSSGSGTGPYTFCNSGSIVAPATGYDYGAASPYPSNIYVTGLPGTVNAAAVLLEGFQTKDQGDLLSLLVGPGGNNLDFFSLTGSNVETAPAPINLTFEDGRSSITGNLSSSGSFEPTSFNTSITYPQCPPNAPLCGSQGVGPALGTASSFTPTNKASTAGTAILGDSNEAGVFGGTPSSTYGGNGTWSLFIDDGGPLGEGQPTSIGGWCVSLTVNLPSISFSGPAPSTFTQGGMGSLPAVTITNNGINGAGSIGDPTQTVADAMTVTDTLPPGLTYLNSTGSTDWNCSSSGQIVTCTNMDTVAVNASYNPLTINVSVSGTASGPLGNNTVSVSDLESSNTPASQSDSVTVDAPPAFTSASSTTFTVGSAGTFLVTASGYPAPSFNESGSLPSGVTFTDNGNGTASLTGTPVSGTGGIYSITIQATNGSSNPSQTFTLTIDQAPAVTSASATSFVGGTAGTFTVTTAGFPTSALSESGSLPSGITFTDNGNGTATLAGTSSVGGTYPFTITANNGIAPIANQSFTLTVTQYALTTTANPAAGGTITPASGSMYNSGTVVPIVATPATGYTFLGWSSTPDAVADATSASTTITMNNSESVTAQFSGNLVVNTPNDDSGSATNCTAQPAPGSNTVDTACSLRDALLNAGAAGAGNITFDSTVFAAPSTITLSNGVLAIPLNTTITGPTTGGGSTPTNLVTVDGGSLSAVFEAIQEYYNGPTISNLNIANGNGGPDPGGAGGIDIVLSLLTLNNCTLTGNQGGDAGAIIIADGLVTITGSTFSGNQSFGGDSTGDGDAGAIYNTGSSSGLLSKLTTRFRSLASNPTSKLTAWPSAAAVKGIRGAAKGLALPTGTPGTLTVINSTFTNNSGVFAGGIFNGFGLLVSGSTFTGNISSSDAFGDADGGAIVNYGFGTVGESVGRPVSAKATRTHHSAASGRMKQALAHALDTPGSSDEYPVGIPSVINSTFSNNSGVYSGGINNAGGFIWVAFSTFNQNSSSGDGLGDADAAGFLSTFGGESIIANNTFFANNSSSQIGAGAMAGVDESLLESYGATASGNSGFYGGLYGDGSSDTYIFNSIVTGNTTTNTSTSSPSDPNVNGVPFDPTTGDIVGDPNASLAPLGNYGGPTQTMIPLPGSSAICAGNLGTLTSVEGDAEVTLTVDQRGFPNTNSTYPGYTSTPCVDAGAVQTSYAIAFTTQPPADAIVGLPLSPVPVVTVTESGLVSAAAAGVINMTDADSALSGGTNSAAISLGTAPFTNLIFSAIESGDTLTASLTLNPNLSPALIIMSQPSTGVNVGAPATLTSPAPGLKTVLPSTNVTFQWTAGTGVTEYQLSLGTTGPGSVDLATYKGTDTSTTLGTMPSNGVTVYARLYSYTYGTWQHNDYVYTESPIPVLATITAPTPGLSTLLAASNVPFQWTAGTGVTLYQLNLGTIAPGSHDLYIYKGSDTSTNVSTLPATGQIVYARLYSLINEEWVYNDYQYTESGSPSAGVLTTPTPGLTTPLGTSNVTFQWTTGTGVDLYELNLGTVPGGHDVFEYKGSATSVNVPSLPANGQIVYARLFSRINGTWTYNDYTYFNNSYYGEGGNAVPAALTSPTPGAGTVLGTSNVPFQWTAGTGVTLYQLNVSAIAPGASELFLYKGAATTATATSLPSNGATVYARLYSFINGAWQFNDYVYTETGSTASAALTSPTPGLATTLGTSNVTFQWTSGTSVSEYQLNLSAVAAGESELFIYKGTATTATAPTLPANGSTVYARLYSKINGVWQYNDYIYSEQ